MWVEGRKERLRERTGKRRKKSYKEMYEFALDSTYVVNKRIHIRRTRRDIREHDRILTKMLAMINFDF